MAESCLKSKLKRKKSSVDDPLPEISSRGAVSGTAETGRSVPPGAAWWKSEQLPAAEGLWALTLKSALPYLDNQHWDPVPDLPHPSTARPTERKSDDQHWCDLSEEVPPFPEPSFCSLRPSLSPDPIRPSSSQQDLSLQTKPGPDPLDRPLSPYCKQSQNCEARLLQALSKKPRLSLESWEVATSSSAGPSRKGGEAGEQEDTGPDRQTVLNQARLSDGRVSLQKNGGNKEEEEQRSSRGDGGAEGGGLKSCPMCLLVFPVGFTQMDCDGHLAQCLSDMNVDMTW